MSAAASARGKATAPTDVDSIMPLLFATIGNPPISFKKMAAMDAENRTESSLEHKFRKWRQLGREIAEKNPEHAGSFTAVTPKKPRAAPVKKGANGKSMGNQPDVGEEEDAVDDHEGFGAVKQGGNGEVPSDYNDKRSVSKDAETEVGENPFKKAKVTKKGTAKVVRKTAARAREVDDDGTGSAQEEMVEAAAPKAKGRAKAASKSKAAANTGKKPTVSKPKSDVVAEHGLIALNGADEAMDSEIHAEEDDGMDGMIPMKFEQED